MSELPPAAEVIDALKHAVAPAAGAAAGLAAVGGFALSRACRLVSADWRGLCPILGVLAAAAGVYAGNRSREVFATDFPPTPGDTDAVLWAAALAFAVELVARLPGVAVGPGLLLRGVAAVVAVGLVVSAGDQASRPWLVPAAGLAAAVQWAVVDAAARRQPGGWVAAALSAAAGGAAVVLIHANWAGGTDAATFLAAGLGVLAGLGWVARADAGAAAAAAVTPLAAVLLVGKLTTFSDVSPATFVIAGLAPSAVGLSLLPGLSRWNGTVAGGVGKVAAVSGLAAWAVYRAATEAPMTFGDKW